ncbi:MULTISPECIES: universal stress protein [Cupriavidus]|uniref:Universal stress protein n=1 Tax=Cupriavidus oxalaticus TaxID=96344 RepID=A0A4P7LSW9_9BURK|nr:MULTISPECIES: universal stress protein [Cupriavidus]MBF6990006.1 universal stress protein [Cupriavidus sp. IK-TO18]QBY55777.1 universal stress protein [Cupriavidus oxalaticus]TDF67438.1 universal stress protein [Cupriavidus sp. L7L]
MYQTILVAIDGSNCGNRALEEAIRLASLCKARLEIVHVVDNGYLMYDVGFSTMADLRPALVNAGTALLSEAEARARGNGLVCSTHLVNDILVAGDIASAIHAEAQRTHAELVVVGTHGRRGVRRLVMGSVAEGLVRDAKVPVLLVRAPQAD